MTSNPLLRDIENILRKDPSRMYSKEEILNILSPKRRDNDFEHLLAELEISSSLKEENKSDIYASCRGGTVYYRWNRQA